MSIETKIISNFDVVFQRKLNFYEKQKIKIQEKRDVIHHFCFQIRIQHGRIINNHLFSFKGAKKNFDLSISVVNQSINH